jgi:hypothetical protein
MFSTSGPMSPLYSRRETGAKNSVRGAQVSLSLSPTAAKRRGIPEVEIYKDRTISSTESTVPLQGNKIKTSADIFSCSEYLLTSGAKKNK